jgi:hypothetical protein
MLEIQPTFAQLIFRRVGENWIKKFGDLSVASTGHIVFQNVCLFAEMDLHLGEFLN